MVGLWGEVRDADAKQGRTLASIVRACQLTGLSVDRLLDLCSTQSMNTDLLKTTCFMQTHETYLRNANTCYLQDEPRALPGPHEWPPGRKLGIVSPALVPVLAPFP